MKKRWIVIPVAVIAAGVVGGNIITAGNKTVVPVVDTYTLSPTDLVSSISVTGTVESENAVNVYTSLTYPIEEVHVEVGDKVAQGDVLCRMETRDLEATIAQTQASLNSAQAKANYSLSMAEKDLETHQFNVDGDYDAALLAAESAVTNAEITLQSANATLASARQKLREYRQDNRFDYDDLTDYDYSDGSYYATLRDAVVQAQNGVESAQAVLEQAEANLRAAKVQAQEQEVTARDSVGLAELNTDFSEQQLILQKLQQDLAEAVITAPASGTVTAVYASEGTVGSGLLFVIEDVEKLMVNTRIKEYDIGDVREGLGVIIKSDGTGDEEYAGVVSKISPTTVKDATGATSESNDGEFEAEVLVTGETGLRIGMNARLTIVTQEKNDIFAVPLDYVVTDEEGRDNVFVLEPQEDDTWIARKIPVESGMETDFYLELVSDALGEGDRIITNPAGLEDGMAVAIPESEPPQAPSVLG